MNKKDLLVAVLLTFCLSVTLFRILPISSSQAPNPYEPWYDLNDDGVIDIEDVRAYVPCKLDSL